jgi:hypothetical protein
VAEAREMLRESLRLFLWAGGTGQSSVVLFEPDCRVIAPGAFAAAVRYRINDTRGKSIE